MKSTGNLSIQIFKIKNIYLIHLAEKETGFYEPYKKYYFRHPKYNNYPVVGISKESALAYCSWLTAKINNQLINDKDHLVKKIIIRLPTHREWKLAAQGGLSNIINYHGMGIH